MPTLYVLSGHDIGRTHQVSNGSVLGRGTDCEVILRAGSVSRRHARLEQDGDSWTVIDLDSRNGLFHEDRRLKRLVLADGMLFNLGDLELRFRVAEIELEFAESAPAPVDRPVPPAPAPPAEPAEPAEPAAEPPAGSEGAFGLGEIELEGEELLDAPPPRPSASPPPGAPPSRPTRPPDAAARRRQAAAVDRAVARQSVVPSTTRSGGPGTGGVRDTSRPVLQFSKVADREGFTSADLGQYPLWVRVLAGVLALATFVGVFFVVFRSMGFLKERGAGDPSVEAPDGE